MRLIGHIDGVQTTSVNGWAADADTPEATLSVGVYVDDELVATIPCTRPREDLLANEALDGNINHGFRYIFPVSLRSDQLNGVAVRFTLSGKIISGSSSAKIISGSGKIRSGLDSLADNGRELTPILVSAPGRSGTTFLMQRLAQSPSILAVEVTPLEVRLLAYWATVYHVLTAPPDFDRSTHPSNLEGDGHRFGSNPFSYDDYRDAFSSAKLASDYFHHYVPEALITFVRQMIHEYYRRIRDDKLKPGARYFAEKGNNIIRQSRETIRHIYPAIKEIIIIRDPRDLFCSHQSYFRSSGEDAFRDVTHSCRELLRIWREKTGGEHFIKYEAMILGEDCFGALSEYLDVPDLNQGDTEREAAVFKVHGTSGSPAASIGRWKNLPADIIEQCNDTWAEFLSEFDYRRL